MRAIRWFDNDTEELDFQQSDGLKASARLLRALRSVGLMALILAAATLVSMGFRHMGLR